MLYDEFGEWVELIKIGFRAPDTPAKAQVGGKPAITTPKPTPKSTPKPTPKTKKR